jgi:hypothetical protein
MKTVMFLVARGLSRAIGTGVEVDTLILIFSWIGLFISMALAFASGLDLTGTLF